MTAKQLERKAETESADEVARLAAAPFTDWTNREELADPAPVRMARKRQAERFPIAYLGERD